MRRGAQRRGEPEILRPRPAPEILRAGATAPTSSQKRRVLHPGPPSQLKLHPTVELSVAEGVSATLTLPFAATETVNSAEHAQETHERSMRQPHAPWVHELAAELSEGKRRAAG